MKISPCAPGVLDWLDTQASPESRAVREELERLRAALRPFADAFEHCGLSSYADSDELVVRALDRNTITPSRGITTRQYREAWEALTGRKAAPHLTAGAPSQEPPVRTGGGIDRDEYETALAVATLRRPPSELELARYRQFATGLELDPSAGSSGQGEG